MASGTTANLAEDMLKAFATGASLPSGSGFKLHLITNAVVPDWDADVLGDFTEIATGNGYDGTGIDVEQSGTGFPTVDESGANDDWRAKIKDISITASGGAVPPSGSGASYALLTDANGTAASRRVYLFLDLSSARTIADGDTLTIKQNSRGEFDIGLAKP